MDGFAGLVGEGFEGSGFSVSGGLEGACLFLSMFVGSEEGSSEGFRRSRPGSWPGSDGVDWGEVGSSARMSSSSSGP